MHFYSYANHIIVYNLRKGVLSLIAAVIPALNEAKSIGLILYKLTLLPIDIIIPVVNGCTDYTRQIVETLTQRSRENSKILPLFFEEALGIDVPRAIGAKKALDLGAKAIIFVDGDMRGNISQGIEQIIQSLKYKGVDLALTDCYCNIDLESITDPLANLVISYRKKLNETLNLYNSIGIASPSHGPHGLSKKLITTIGFKPLAIPPLILTLAKINNLKIKIAADIPHDELGSSLKDLFHASNIAQTIIGDCLEAMATYENRTPTRSRGSKEYLGYHPQRRWDLLSEYLSLDKTENKKD
jgi:glycosyltransferase involved in cell wall biosynthesis